jgi:hypothetical protein
MGEKTELVHAVIEAAVEIQGKKRLPCAEAFRLAECFSVERLEIGRICNAHQIRISKCQLGCFK